MDEWDPDEKEKNITQDREIKVNGGTTMYNKNKGGSIRLGSKVRF